MTCYITPKNVLSVSNKNLAQKFDELPFTAGEEVRPIVTTGLRQREIRELVQDFITKSG